MNDNFLIQPRASPKPQSQPVLKIACLSWQWSRVSPGPPSSLDLRQPAAWEVPQHILCQHCTLLICNTNLPHGSSPILASSGLPTTVMGLAQAILHALHQAKNFGIQAPLHITQNNPDLSRSNTFHLCKPSPPDSGKYLDIPQLIPIRP